MTELNRAGEAGSLGHIDTIQGDFRNQIDVVADELRQLAGNADVPNDPLSAPYVLYVNPYTGNDVYISGDYTNTGDLERRISLQKLEAGYTEARPFRTINRAVIEAGIITSAATSPPTPSVTVRWSQLLLPLVSKPSSTVLATTPQCLSGTTAKSPPMLS